MVFEAEEACAKLEQDLMDAVSDKESTEERLSKQLESLRKLRESTVQDFEAKVRERQQRIEELEQEASAQEERLLLLEKEMGDLKLKTKELQEGANNDTNESRAQIVARSLADYKEQIELLKSRNSSLVETVKALQDELKSAEESATRMKEDKSDRAHDAEEFERNVVATYERKMQLLRMDHDVAMDYLRKELTEAKERTKGLELEKSNLTKALETATGEIKAKLEAKLEIKNARILQLEQTLAAQEEVAGHMRVEMDQLQTGMDKVSLTRRAEIEEMEQELMESATRATKYEREITSLKMKVEERKLRHKDEVEKLKKKIIELQEETPMERNVRAQRDKVREEELNKKIDQLKWRLSGLQEDNQKLREKLESAEGGVHGGAGGHKRTPSSSEKWRVASLQEQVALLTQRNRELEKDLLGTESTLSTIDAARGRSSSASAVNGKEHLETPKRTRQASTPELRESIMTSRTTTSSRATPDKRQESFSGDVPGIRSSKSFSPTKYKEEEKAKQQGRGQKSRLSASPRRIRAQLAGSPRIGFSRNKNRGRHSRSLSGNSTPSRKDEISTHTEMTF
uniref:Uncharacterized protein n=1 Tax=Trieres chinensis TaxID=1514140 RepID=A0A7S1ZMT5_TRICV